MTAALVHDYQAQGACRELFSRRESEVLVVGPAGTGKSRACLEKVHTMCLLNPGMRALMVRKTAASLTSSAVVTWKRDVAAETLAAGVVWYYGGSSEEPPQYRFENGSKVVLGGMDKSSKIMSTEYDLIYVQEATELTEDDWESLTSRLRSYVVSFQQLIADCNPAEDTHWLKKRCDKGLTVMLRSRHEDNPLLFDSDGELTPRGVEYIGLLDRLTGVRYRRLRRGEWSSAEGVIYEEWESAVHLVDRFDIPDEWTRWWSVDFGFTNPFVLQCWAEDPDGRLFMYRELYHTGRTTDEHTAQILSIVAPDGTWTEPRPRAVICDHDAEGQAVLARELGLPTRNADKAVRTGIEAVMRRLRDRGDGRRRLYLMRDSLVERDESLTRAGRPTCTADEIPGYVWQQSAGKAPKEAPVKEDDHGCLIVGTEVLTDQWKLPIEQVTTDHQVWTRDGWRNVIGVGMTHPAAEVWKVQTSRGDLIGTPDHPVFVDDWTRIDCLQPGMEIRFLYKLTATVETVEPLPFPEPVYNLTVDGTPEFYANGLLVHNCDSLRYMVMARETGPPPKLMGSQLAGLHLPTR